MDKKSNEHYLKNELYELIKKDSSVFDFIQEGSLDGMWYWNLEKIEDEWMSPKFWEVLGYNPDEKKHSSSEWQDIIFEDDLKEATKNFEKHLQNQNHPYDQIVRYKHKNGSTVWIRCRGVSIKDSKGKPIRMLGAHTNITELKQKEQSLRESEKRFRILHNASFGGIAVHDKGYILDCNQGLADITGFAIDELIGMDGLLLIAPDHRDFVMSKIVAGYEKPYETFGIRKNKEIYPLKLEARNIPYEGKQVRVVEFRDITELKKSVDAKRKIEEYYDLLTIEMPLGLNLREMIYDSKHNPIDYRFLSANASYETITGLKNNDIIGKTAKEVLPDIENYWIDKYAEVVSTGKSVQFEEYSRALGKYFKVTAYLVHESKFAVIVEDITGRILLENQRIKENKDLLTSQKIAKLGTWRLDIKTNEVVWSEELYKMYGFDPNQPVPPYTEHMKLFTKPSWEKLSTALSLTSTKGIPYELELETVHSDGSNGWMWVRGEAETDEKGEIITISGAAQDITNQKHLENQLNQTNQIVSTILDKSPVAIEFYDLNGNHTYSNDSSLELFGVIDPNELQRINLLTNPNVDKDLLSKIVNLESIKKVIEYDFEKVKERNLYQTTKSGKIILEIVITPLNSDNRISGYIVHSKDVTEEKTKEKEILHISNHDFLTDIPNRRYFSESLEKLDNEKYYPLGIMMLDINGLKLINDSFGYDQGDKAIRYVADVIKNLVDSKDVIARFGGDEFGIIMPNTSRNDITLFQEKLSNKIATFSIQDVNLSIAMGHSIKFDRNTSVDLVIKKAEENMFKSKVLEGRSMRSAAIHAILETLTNKYNVEKIHSEKVSEYCYQMGEALNLSKDYKEELKLAGLLHDIGKISIPDHILNKPGKLDDEEWEVMRKHTIFGYNILRAADEYSNLALIALTHHERWDGNGYPRGLSKNEIPLFSRIIAVVDAYEAMTADRPYRKAPGKEFAIQELIKCKSTQFDPDMVDLFLKHVVGYHE